MARCSEKAKVPLTVTVMDKSEILTPEALQKEILVLRVNGSGCWAVRPLKSLTLGEVNATLDNPRTAFLLLEDAPQETGTNTNETA